jgi:ClpP class serine protease
MQKHTAHQLLISQTWAIQPEMLEIMSDITLRENETIQAVEAKLGRPLDNSQTAQIRGDTAVIPVVGPIFRRANLFARVSGATSTETLAADLTTAAEDPNIKQIVLNMDSPGGQANGIAELAQMIRAIDKPVIAYVDGMAASAAYWLASAADRIVLSKTAEVGSIGAVVAYDTSKKDGIAEIVSTQSPKKRPNMSSEEGKAQIQRRIDALAQVFVEDVAAYRGTTVDTVLDQFGQGDMLMGAEAVAAGMADEISTFESLIAGIAGKTQPNRRSAYMTAITREWLAENHADLLNAIEASAHEKGVIAERERIADIDAAALPGHDALIARLKADGSAPDAALKAILGAEKTRLGEVSQQQESAAPAPVAFAVSADDHSDNRSLDERCADKWATDADLRKEFGSLASYTAYIKATETGRARTLTKNRG